ncbi:hypothetical protein D3C87_2193980 [compost metagenome]
MFEYNSGTNERFLSIEEIRLYNQLARTDISFTLADIEAGRITAETVKGILE